MKNNKSSYLGSKHGAGVYQAIINLMPPHQVYIEAFAGTGAVMNRKPRAAQQIAIEKNLSSIDQYDYTADKVINGCAIEYIEGLPVHALSETVLYCDPPYVHSTRTSKARYQCELSDLDHLRLINALLKLKSENGYYVLLSGYSSNLYKDNLTWQFIEFQAMTRGGVRTETLWHNFVPGKVHYHTYAGKNALDRQRIKRKAERWANKIQSLPKPEQQAILAAVLAKVGA